MMGFLRGIRRDKAEGTSMKFGARLGMSHDKLYGSAVVGRIAVNEDAGLEVSL